MVRIDDDTLLEIAKAIPSNKVKELGLKLNFSLQISKGYSDSNDGVLNMLQDWRERTKPKQQKKELTQALENCGLREVAEIYLKGRSRPRKQATQKQEGKQPQNGAKGKDRKRKASPTPAATAKEMKVENVEDAAAGDTTFERRPSDVGSAGGSTRRKKKPENKKYVVSAVKKLEDELKERKKNLTKLLKEVKKEEDDISKLEEKIEKKKKAEKDKKLKEAAMHREKAEKIEKEILNSP